MKAPRYEKTASVRAISPPEEDFRFNTNHVVLLLTLFLLTRLLFLLNFPIFNDEANLIQYAQLISQDWDTNKFISVRNIFADWKPPLPYWLLSILIRWIEHPLLAARLVSVLASLVGLLTIYAFSGYFFKSEKIALWTSVFWIFNPMLIFYDREFVAETYVYSFSAAAYLFTFLTLSKNKLYALPATFFGTLAILSKQSGQLYVYGLIFFTALLITRKSHGKARKRIVVDYRNVFFVVLIIGCSYLIYRLVIPAEYFKDYAGTNRYFMFTPEEILRFPVDAWMGNVRRIFDLFRHYYSLLSLVLITVFIHRCISRKNSHDVLVLAWFAFNSFLMVIYFKYYNEYMYNTSTIIFLGMIMGVAIDHLRELGEKIRLKPVKLFLQYGGVGLLLMAIWSYQLAYYYTSPITYVEKFGSPWMQEHYLKGWPSGFGVQKALDIMAQERNKYVFVDPQWGNPGASIELYAKNYPSLQIMPISNVVIDALGRLKPDTALVIFRDRHRDLDKFLLNEPICNKRIIIKETENQTPLYVCKN